LPNKPDQFATIAATMGYVADDVAVATQLECAGSGYNPDCETFLYDQNRDRMRTLWKEMTIRSATSPKYVELLEDIQTEGECCGFEPPVGCVFGPNQPWPASVFLNNKTSTNLPTFCGPEKNWYPATENCNPKVEMPDLSLYEPGCAYFLPAGRCLVFDYKKGCVYQAQVFIFGRFVPLLNLAKTLTFSSVLAGLVAFFLFLKRKDEDVLPTAYVVATRPKDVDG